MNQIYSTCCWLLLALTASCTGQEFTIEGQIDGTPQATVTIAYIGDQGVVTQNVKLEKGNTLNYTGHSQDYTLLSMWDEQGQLIAQMVLKDGDKMTIKSDGFQLPTPNIKGNKVTEQWMEFRKDNHKAFIGHDEQTVDHQIEQYIKQHPDNLLATVLLVTEYSQINDVPKLKTLLQSIKPEAKPQRLVGIIDHLLTGRNNMPSLLTELTLYRHGEGIADLKTKGNTAVLLFWSKGDAQRQTCIDTLQSLAQRYGSQVTIADVLVDTDSTAWSRVIKAEQATWSHWWAPGGIMDPMLNGIQISRTPMWLVTDSAAHIVHTGHSHEKMFQAVQQLLQ